MAISPDMRHTQAAGSLRARYSSVMADHPRFVQQALTLVWTLLDLAEVLPADIVVHVLDGSDPGARRQLDALGIETRACRPFRAGHPHCNKIRQLEDARLVEADVVVLCDTDVAFVHPITDGLRRDVVRAKVVDLPNPPMDAWRRILAAAGLPEPPVTHTSFGEHPTPSWNCNGGLYLLPGAAARRLAVAWPARAAWLIDRPELLPGRMQVHVDQVAFGLAVCDLGLPVDLLPLAWNYPTHDAVSPKPDVVPRLLHYHDHVDPSGFLKPVGLADVDRAIARVNDVIRARRRSRFDNPSFWNFRYAQAPDLGSGVGSRGEHLEYKRDLLARVIPPDASVLDVGCGDLEVSRTLPVASFTGVDVSAGAIELARGKRPDWTFVLGQLPELDLPLHDVVVSFDVLIHQPTVAAYRTLVADLVRLARHTVVIGAYDEPPRLTSEITFYYEPISASLARLVGDRHVGVVGGYRDAAVVAASVDAAHATAPAVDLLRRARIHDTPLGRFAAVPGDLIATQFDAYGGHTRNELAMVLSLLDPGDIVVDIGAHIGSFAVPIARHVGALGRVLAVEPDPGNVELLYRNLVLNQVDTRVDVAETVAASGGVMVTPAPADGNTGALHFVPDARGARPTETVDALVDRHLPNSRPRLLKIDVEGMELSVLESARTTIDRARPLIYCEVVESQLVRQGTSLDDLDRFLRHHDYALYRNSGDRNSRHDRFDITSLSTLAAGGPFFDCLAIPSEQVARLVEAGRLPAAVVGP
jgi:FkbM family methyltransferase